MKQDSSRKKTTRSTRGNAQGSVFDGHGKPSAIAEFAATRAHELTDTMYALAKGGIDRAQTSLTELRLETVWRHALPLLQRAGSFVRAYPFRSAGVVGLLAGAVLLSRGQLAGKN